MTASPCSTVNRSNAWYRCSAIIAGHSALCAATGADPACPIATGRPLTPGRLGAALAAMNETLPAMRPATDLQGAREVESGERVRWDYEPRPMGYQRKPVKP